MRPKPKKKPVQPTSTVPAWTCPKCGATHPITVQGCCYPPIDQTIYPPMYPLPTKPQWPQWPASPVTCGSGGIS